MYTYPKQELWFVCKQRVGKGFSEILFLGRFDIAPKSLSHPKPSHRWEGGWRKHHPFKYHSYSFWIIWNSYSSWYDLDYLKAQMKNRFPMGSSVLITGKISTTPSQFRDPVILRVKTFIIGIYGKYESNTCEQTENSRKNKLAKQCKFRFLAPLWFYLKVLCI